MRDRGPRARRGGSRAVEPSRRASPRRTSAPPRAISGARHDVPHFEPRWAVGLRRSDPSFAAWLAQLTNAVESGTWSAGAPSSSSSPPRSRRWSSTSPPGTAKGSSWRRSSRGATTPPECARCAWTARRREARLWPPRPGATREVLASLLDAGLDPNAGGRARHERASRGVGRVRRRRVAVVVRRVRLDVVTRGRRSRRERVAERVEAPSSPRRKRDRGRSSSSSSTTAPTTR